MSSFIELMSYIGSNYWSNYFYETGIYMKNRNRIEKCYYDITKESMRLCYQYSYEIFEKHHSYTFKRLDSKRISTEKFCDLLKKEFGEKFLEMYSRTSDGIYFTLYISNDNFHIILK